MRGSKTYTSSSAADPKKRGRGNPQEGSTYVCADMGKGIRKQGANGGGVGGGSGENSRIGAHEKGGRRSPHRAHSLMAFQSLGVGGSLALVEGFCFRDSLNSHRQGLVANRGVG